MTNNGKNIHRDFNKQLAQEGIIQGFNYNQTQDGINIGMTPQDAYYCGGLRDVKDKDCLGVLNYGDDELLRIEYKTGQVNLLNNLTAPNHTPVNYYGIKRIAFYLILAYLTYQLITTNE